jgi:hypothetical protein
MPAGAAGGLARGRVRREVRLVQVPRTSFERDLPYGLQVGNRSRLIEGEKG